MMIAAFSVIYAGERTMKLSTAIKGESPMYEPYKWRKEQTEPVTVPLLHALALYMTAA